MPSPYVLQILIGARNTAGGVLSQVKTQLESLQRVAGKQSLFGDIADIAQGRGGPLGGLFDLTNQATTALAALRQMRVEFGLGELSAGAIAENLIRSIPVFGQAWSLGREIRSQFDGTVDEAIELEKAQRRANAELAKSKELLDRTRDAYANLKTIAQTAFRTERLGNAGSPFEQRRLQAGFEFDDAAIALEQQLRDGVISGGGFDRGMADLKRILEQRMRDIVEDQFAPLIRETDAAMADAIGQIVEDRERQRVANITAQLGTREFNAELRLAGIDRNLEAIGERASIAPPEFLQRGSAAEARLQQDQETARQQARDTAEMLKAQKAAQEDLRAIRALLDNVRNNRGGGVIDFTQF